MKGDDVELDGKNIGLVVEDVRLIGKDVSLVREQ